MKNKLIDLICERLDQNLEKLKNQFERPLAFSVARHFFLDHLLPDEITQTIYANFPQKNQMRLMKSFREKKYTYKQLSNTPKIIQDVTFAIQHPKVIAFVEKITGIQQQNPDPSLYAGGISTMTKGHFLNPHIDNSHSSDRQQYRTVNLLYYVTPNWKESFGGNLELWDSQVKYQVIIPSLFNRLVVMETNQTSWHSVSPVTYDGARCCVSNYYFSPLSPEGKNYFNVTSFSARPEQQFRRVISKVDNLLRNQLRYIFRFGLGKKDIYQ